MVSVANATAIDGDPQCKTESASDRDGISDDPMAPDRGGLPNQIPFFLPLRNPHTTARDCPSGLSSSAFITHVGRSVNNMPYDLFLSFLRSALSKEPQAPIKIPFTLWLALITTSPPDTEVKQKVRNV